MPNDVAITLPMTRLLGIAYKGTVPDTLVMNTINFAVTEYLNYAFNSFTRFNGKDLAANQNGIYELDNTNVDTPKVGHVHVPPQLHFDEYVIKAHIKSGQVDVYNGTVQRLRNAFLSYESDGDVRMTSVADKAATRTYYLGFQVAISGIRERRIKFERGIKNRRFDFKIENINGSSLEIDGLTILTEPIISKRR